jgi:hypothetical protein
LGIGDWGLGIGPNPQSPIPNTISIFYFFIKYRINQKYININMNEILNNFQTPVKK